MFHTIHFPKVLSEQQPTHRTEEKRFLQLAHSLGKPIQKELTAFARAVWPGRRRFGFRPHRRYRLRRRISPGQAFWWIEIDIPPADTYRCAAYRVELRRRADGNNGLFFRSGRQDYALDPNDLSSLHAVLLQAASDPALVIPRQMGPAFD